MASTGKLTYTHGFLNAMLIYWSGNGARPADPGRLAVPAVGPARAHSCPRHVSLAVPTLHDALHHTVAGPGLLAAGRRVVMSADVGAGARLTRGV